MSNDQMTVSSFLNFGIECTKKNWLKLFGLSVYIFFAGVLMGGVTLVIVRGIGGTAVEFINPIASIVGLLVGIFLSFGFLKNILNVCRGQEVDFKAFFSVKPKVILNYIVAMFIVGAAVFVGFLLIIPGIIVSYMLLMTPFLIVDRELDAIEAITESLRLTKGHIREMFWGLFIGLLLTGLCSMFIITIIFTAPMQCCLMLYPYLYLTGGLDDAKKRLAPEPSSANL
jgi:membrane-anchored glycerophosphoryl diester phosphodiesterase (GDPDase)